MGQMLPLLAMAVYIKSPVASASAAGMPLLPLFICAGTAVLGCTSSVWLPVDTFSARVVEPDGPWPREMRSTVARMVVSAASFALLNAVGVGMLSRGPTRS